MTSITPGGSVRIPSAALQHHLSPVPLEVPISTDVASRPKPGASPAAADVESTAPRRPWRIALAVLVGLLAGLAVALLGGRLLDGSDGGPDTAAPGTGTTEQPETSAEELAQDATPPGGAPSPDAAVRGFLDAEVATDFDTSFAFLSAEDRRLYGSPAGWTASHADVLAPVVSYELGAVTTDGDRASVVTDVRFEPGLDQVVGLTPDRASVTWDVAADEDGGWGVALETSTMEPVLPSDDGVEPAVRRWVDARRACEVPANEHATLVGAPALADSLCGGTGEVELGATAPLGSLDADPVLTAFGPEAAAAARLVRTSGPVELGVVAVPVGETWIVIGVVP